MFCHSSISPPPQDPSIMSFRKTQTQVLCLAPILKTGRKLFFTPTLIANPTNRDAPDTVPSVLFSPTKFRALFCYHFEIMRSPDTRHYNRFVHRVRLPYKCFSNIVRKRRWLTRCSRPRNSVHHLVLTTSAEVPRRSICFCL